MQATYPLNRTYVTLLSGKSTKSLTDLRSGTLNFSNALAGPQGGNMLSSDLFDRKEFGVDTHNKMEANLDQHSV